MSHIIDELKYNERESKSTHGFWLCISANLSTLKKNFLKIRRECKSTVATSWESIVDNTTFAVFYYKYKNILDSNK